MNRTPYVYRLIDSICGMWYVGANYGEGAHPSKLGVGYFTSSKIVEPIFRENPNRFQKEILLIGPIDYVVEMEAAYLKLVNAKDDPMSYNGHNGDGKMNMVKAGRLGVANRSFESRSGAGKIGGKKATITNKLNNTGIFNPLNRIKRGKEVGRLRAETTDMKKLGALGGAIGGLKGGKTTASQKWKCDECGLISHPGALGTHQKATSHKGKERLS